MDLHHFLVNVAIIYFISLGYFPDDVEAAMSIANQDIERYFRSAAANANTSQTFPNEERITMDVYTYAFLNYSYKENNIIQQVNFNEEKARYGEGKILTVQGRLIHVSASNDVNDDTACTSNILGTKGQPIPYGAWIALVRRGHCTFEEKVKNVYAKGAAGVIIYNDKPVVNLEKMQIKGKSRNITAVITYLEIGSEMAMLLDRDIEVIADIIEGRSGMRPINTFTRTSILFVAISFIILMVISLVWLIFYYIQKFRYMQTKDQQSRHLCSVTKKAIMKIPTKTGKSTDEKDADSDCCAICIEAYKISDLIRVLPCKHEFHKSCIDPWLLEHRTCPMCKLDVLKFYGYVVGDEVNTIPAPPQYIATVPSLNDTDVPVVVVGVMQQQQQQQQQYHQQYHHQTQINHNNQISSNDSSDQVVQSNTNSLGITESNSVFNVPVETISVSSCNSPSLSADGCPMHGISATTNTANDLCSWHISVPGLNRTINSNRPFMVESTTNDNSSTSTNTSNSITNDSRTQHCTSSRQVTDV